MECDCLWYFIFIKYISSRYEFESHCWFYHRPLWVNGCLVEEYYFYFIKLYSHCVTMSTHPPLPQPDLVFKMQFQAGSYWLGSGYGVESIASLCEYIFQPRVMVGYHPGSIPGRGYDSVSYQKNILYVRNGHSMPQRWNIFQSRVWVCLVSKKYILYERKIQSMHRVCLA